MPSYNDYSGYDDPTEFQGYYSDIQGPPASAAEDYSAGPPASAMGDPLDSWITNYYAGDSGVEEYQSPEGTWQSVDDFYANFQGPPASAAGGNPIGNTLGDVFKSVLSQAKNLGGAAGKKLLDSVIDPETRQPNWRSLAALGGGLYGLSQSGKEQEKSGFQGGIPKYEAIREAVPGVYDPERRPGSGGQRYFSDTRYAAPEGAAAARGAAQQEAEGLAALNRTSPTREAVARAEGSAAVNEPSAPVGYATGGLTALAKGGVPRYLNGASDGMADKIPARIDDGQEARLSHGEFVIPADVVGHLGNGNSEAGAQRLYTMMEQIRKARTGNPKQGKQINPNKFLPS